MTSKIKLQKLQYTTLETLTDIQGYIEFWLWGVLGAIAFVNITCRVRELMQVRFMQIGSLLLGNMPNMQADDPYLDILWHVSKIISLRRHGLLTYRIQCDGH